MKKSFVLLFAMVCFIHSQAQGFTVKGNITGLPDNSAVYMVSPGNEADTIAKATVNKGSFELKGTVSDVDSRFLVFPSVNQRMVLYMGNESFNITGKADDIFNVRIDGGQFHKDYEDFLLFVKPISDMVDYYRGGVQSARTQSMRDSMSLALNTVYNIYQNTIDRFVSRKNNSPMSALVLAFVYDTDPNKDLKLVENRFNQLTDNAKNSKYGKHLNQLMQDGRIGAIGTKAIDFTQNDENNKPVSLSQFKGKYVLIDFWASWCKPCRVENPNVVAAYKKFKDKNFTVLGVSLDQNKENWLQAIKVDNLTWTHVSDLKFWGNAVAQLYRIQSIPQNLLIDPNGVIIAKNLRGQDLVDKLAEVIK